MTFTFNNIILINSKIYNILHKIYEKDHLLKLIDWMYQEVLSSGGDGDCLWYSKHYTLEQILPLIEEFNSNLKWKWSIEFDKVNRMINFVDNQECLIITDNKEIYDRRPDWQQCVIVT